MLGKRDIRESIGFVTLGLFSNALIDELLEAAHTPDAPPKRQKMLKLAIDSIKEIENPETIKRPHLEELVFQDYQEASTLRQVLHESDTHVNNNDIIKYLETIVDEQVASKDRNDNIIKAIEFFCKLGRAAIVNSECPEEQVPSGVAALGF